MIRISKMADYAVVVLAAMNKGFGSGQTMSAAVLAQETHLPEPTVSKLLKMLNRAGIVKSVRGINGGYVIQHSARDISVARIITAVDGPIAIVACADGQVPDCSLTEICGVRGRWDDVNTAIREALEGVTLADMMPKRKAEAREMIHGRH